MTPIQTYVRRIALTVVSSGALISTAAVVHAQDAGGFLDQLFGVRRAPEAVAPAPAPVQLTYRHGPTERFQAYRAKRHSRSAQHPRIRYVALPPDPEKITGKQPVDAKAIAANPTAALLKDETLRPGDIVVLPSGPKVYTGDAGRKRRLSDFEDVRNSASIDKKTRALLLSMMVPVGALPADEARRTMAKLRKLRPAEDASPAVVEAHNVATGTRVINPWQTNP